MEKEKIIRMLSSFKGEQVTNSVLESMANDLCNEMQNELVERMRNIPIELGSGPEPKKKYLVQYLFYPKEKRLGYNINASVQFGSQILELPYEELDKSHIILRIKQEELLHADYVVKIQDIKPL